MLGKKKIVEGKEVGYQSGVSSKKKTEFTREICDDGVYNTEGGGSPAVPRIMATKERLVGWEDPR